VLQVIEVVAQALLLVDHRVVQRGQQFIACRDGLVDEMGEGLGLLAALDQRQVRGADVPEGGEARLQLRVAFPALGGEQAALVVGQGRVDQLALAADVGQRGGQLLRVARQHGMAQQQRNLRHGELEFSGAVQLRHAPVLGAGGQLDGVAEPHGREDRDTHQRQRDDR